MIKNVFNNLSRGIFYTIGRFIAFIVIGALIMFILSKLDINIPNTYPIDLFNGLLINVNAKEITSSNTGSVQETITNIDAEINHIVTNSPWANWGTGYLYFTFSLNKISGTSVTPNVFPRSTVAYSGDNAFICEIGTSSTGNSTWNSSVFSAKCPMKMGSSGLTKISVQFASLQQNDNSQYRFIMGGIKTFEQTDSTNVNLDTSGTTNAINNQITNDNSNTQNIINNENKNTQNIINNENKNTQDIIDSNQVCAKITVTNNDIVIQNKLLDNNGIETYSTSGNGITRYFEINGYIKNIVYANSTANACFYTENKTVISCIQNKNMTQGGNLTVPSNAKFIRFTINSTTNIPQFEIESCKNGNQAIVDSNKENTDKQIQNNNENTKKVIDSINDDDISALEDNSSGGGAGHYFDSINQSSSTPITDLLLMPLHLLEKLTDSLGSNNCSPYTLPFDFFGGSNTITFPCINLGSNKYLGSVLWNTIDLLFCGFMVYNIGMLIISFYESWSSLTDTFDSLYEPTHANTGYKPRHMA